MLKNKKNIIISLIIIMIPASLIFVDKFFLNGSCCENGISQQSEARWLTYTDNRYNYSVDFPNYLNISTIYEKEVSVSKTLGGGTFIINGGVSFGEADLGNFVRIRVVISENTKFKDTDEWLNSKNEKFDYPRKYLEKEISIDGYNAIVVHEMGGISKQTEEHFWNEKTAVFVKDGTLFEIYTRYGLGDERRNEPEKIWKSFKFLDSE